MLSQLLKTIILTQCLAVAICLGHGGDSAQDSKRLRAFYQFITEELENLKTEPSTSFTGSDSVYHGYHRRFAAQYYFLEVLYRAAEKYQQEFSPETQRTYAPLSQRIANKLTSLKQALSHFWQRLSPYADTEWMDEGEKSTARFSALSEWFLDLGVSSAARTAKSLHRFGAVYGTFVMLGYPPYFLLTEYIEHALLYLPPGLGCAALQAAYFGAAAFGKSTFTSLGDRTGDLNAINAPLRVCQNAYYRTRIKGQLGVLDQENPNLILRRSDYLRARLTSDPVETLLSESPFWIAGFHAFHSARNGSDPVPVNDTDWTKLFQSDSRDIRAWMAMQQVNTLYFMENFLQLLLWPSYKDGLSTKQEYIRAQAVMGKIQKFIDGYYTSIMGLALSNKVDDLETKTKSLQWFHDELMKLFTQARELVMENHSKETSKTIAVLSNKVNLLLEQHSRYRKNKLTGQELSACQDALAAAE